MHLIRISIEREWLEFFILFKYIKFIQYYQVGYFFIKEKSINQNGCSKDDCDCDYRILLEFLPAFVKFVNNPAMILFVPPTQIHWFWSKPKYFQYFIPSFSFSFIFPQPSFLLWPWAIGVFFIKTYPAFQAIFYYRCITVFKIISLVKFRFGKPRSIRILISIFTLILTILISFSVISLFPSIIFISTYTLLTL